MFRWPTLLCLWIATAICCSPCSAQRRGAVGGFRAPTIEFFGLGGFVDGGRSNLNYYHPYGFNPYVYDPYLTGSFRAPDLLDDPHFRARTRHQSRYPGRRPRLRLKK